jgi:hypothetical protein
LDESLSSKTATPGQSFQATVETRTVREEHVSFPLPRELRVISRA